VNTLYQASQVKPKLGASADDFSGYFNSDTGLNFSAISSTLSMFVWDLLWPKQSWFLSHYFKRQETITSTLPKLLGMFGLIAVATLCKLNADNHYLDSTFAPQQTEQVNHALQASYEIMWLDGHPIY